jgi:UDP-glucose-4-epimerase GalE
MRWQCYCPLRCGLSAAPAGETPEAAWSCHVGLFLRFHFCKATRLNILVTGGAGYVGSHACKALAARGHVPITYDNLSRGNHWAVKWGPFEKGDIADLRQIRMVLEKYQPSALMHFAAYAYVGESVEQPLLYYRNNFADTVTLLQAVVDFRRMPVVFSSSCATYGVPERVPITENHPQHPINAYGYSKLFVERVLADLTVACGLPWIALRYFNAAGADPDGEIGEAHDPETHLIPLVLAAARTGAPVRIFGKDYDTPDGTCVRDYVHVSDIADAHVRALDYLLEGGSSCALNLANARGYSIKEVIAVAEKVCRGTVPLEIVGRRPGDPPILIGDAALARVVLGWRPVHSDLETQIRHAWNWIERGDITQSLPTC